MSAGGLQMRRSTPERLAAWLLTGPIGHLVGFLADVVVLWSRWGAAHARRALKSTPRAPRSAGERGTR